MDIKPGVESVRDRVGSQNSFGAYHVWDFGMVIRLPREKSSKIYLLFKRWGSVVKHEDT